MSENVQTFESKWLGERYYRVLHASGLPVYVFPKEMTAAYALFAVNFGEVDNAASAEGARPFPAGIAHFLEHKLFSNEDGSDSFERFSAYGADANAYTSHTKTVYMFTATDRFDESFGELIDFVSHPYFTEASVKKEKGIIAEEIRMCRDNPYDRCYYNMLEGLYHCHPIKTEICGSIRSVSEITAEMLYECYNTHYHPENMAVVVCGNVTVDAVMDIVNKRLPKAGPWQKPQRVTVDEPATVHRDRVIDHGQVGKPIFSIGVKDVCIPTDTAARFQRDAAMAILSEMLFSESGELYHSLLDRGMVSPDFSASFALAKDFGFLQISGEADDPEAVLREVLDHLEQQRQNGLSAEDFERVRRVEYAECIKGYDSTEEIANTLLSFVFEGGEIFAYADLLRNMTFTDVQRLFEEFFVPSRFTLSVVYPNPKSEETGD